MAAEALAIAVRQNKEINGITKGKEETKLLQYADDMNATLSDTTSLQALLDQLEVFKNVSGLTINCDKTEGMWIGSLRSNKMKLFGLKWPEREPIKALGVYYSYDEKLLYEKKIIENLDKIKKTYKHLVVQRSTFLWKGDNNQSPCNPQNGLFIFINTNPRRSNNRIKSNALKISVERYL